MLTVEEAQINTFYYCLHLFGLCMCIKWWKVLSVVYQRSEKVQQGPTNGRYSIYYQRGQKNSLCVCVCVRVWIEIELHSWIV